MGGPRSDSGGSNADWGHSRATLRNRLRTGVIPAQHYEVFLRPGVIPAQNIRRSLLGLVYSAQCATSNPDTNGYTYLTHYHPSHTQSTRTNNKSQTAIDYKEKNVFKKYVSDKYVFDAQRVRRDARPGYGPAVGVRKGRV